MTIEISEFDENGNRLAFKIGSGSESSVHYITSLSFDDSTDPDDNGFYTGVLAITRSPLDNLVGYKADLVRINQDTGEEEIIGKIIIHEITDVNDIEDDVQDRKSVV